jgi:hypothetical protein
MVTGAGCVTFRYNSCVAQEVAARTRTGKMKYFFMADIYSIVIIQRKKAMNGMGLLPAADCYLLFK